MAPPPDADPVATSSVVASEPVSWLSVVLEAVKAALAIAAVALSITVLVAIPVLSCGACVFTVSKAWSAGTH